MSITHRLVQGYLQNSGILSNIGAVVICHSNYFQTFPTITPKCVVNMTRVFDDFSTAGTGIAYVHFSQLFGHRKEDIEPKYCDIDILWTISYRLIVIKSQNSKIRFLIKFALIWRLATLCGGQGAPPRVGRRTQVRGGAGGGQQPRPSPVRDGLRHTWTFL